MKSNFKEMHVLAPFIVNFIMIIITISTNNFIVSLLILIYSVYIFYLTKNLKRTLRGIFIFLPVLLVTSIINIAFTNQGGRVIFRIAGKSFTLEAFFYAFILALKLMIVIYLFECISLMLDSDRAVSYFSSIMPKSTLVFMISFKLFPTMKQRIGILRDIYSIRGVDYEGNNTLKKLKSYIPVMSILLEDSLEKSFDIGEAAYVRGFLSEKRTVYERQHLKIYDFALIVTSLLILLSYIIYYLMGYDSFGISNNGLKFMAAKNILLILVTFFIVLYAEVSPLGRRLSQKNELY